MPVVEREGGSWGLAWELARRCEHLVPGRDGRTDVVYSVCLYTAVLSYRVWASDGRTGGWPGDHTEAGACLEREERGRPARGDAVIY